MIYSSMLDMEQFLCGHRSRRVASPRPHHEVHKHRPHPEERPPISGLPEIGSLHCASRRQPTCVGASRRMAAYEAFRHERTGLRMLNAQSAEAALQDAQPNLESSGPRIMALADRLAKWS